MLKTLSIYGAHNRKVSRKVKPYETREMCVGRVCVLRNLFLLHDTIRLQSLILADVQPKAYGAMP